MKQVASVVITVCLGQRGYRPGNGTGNDRNAGKEKRFIFAKNLCATFTNAAVN